MQDMLLLESSPELQHAQRLLPLPNKFHVHSISSLTTTRSVGEGGDNDDNDEHPETSSEMKLNEGLPTKATVTSDTAQQKQQQQEEEKQEQEAVLAWRMRLADGLHRRDTERAQLLTIHQRLVSSYSSPSSSGETINTAKPSSSAETNSTNAKEMILLSGPSGSGKARLAKTTMKPLMVVDDVDSGSGGGYLLTGKFDRLNVMSPAPYSAFCSAFTEFAHLVQNRGETATLQIRDSIRLALGGDERAVLTRMIPGLDPLCGHDHDGDHNQNAVVPSKQAKAADAMQRFVFVFKSFLRAVTSPEHPMVLLLIDIHFADPCSIDLLSSIVLDRQNCGLVVICTVDSCLEMQPSYLSSKLKDIEDGQTIIQQISVSNLETSQVTRVLKDVLSLQDDSAASLAHIVMQQTKGNPSDVIEFLCWLRETHLLEVDHSDHTTSSRWCWDADEVDMTINTRQVGDFLMDKLKQLPSPVKDVLKVSACLGPFVKPQLLEFVLSVDVEPALMVATAKGMMFLDPSRGDFVFEHDRIQAAAYALIPEGDRELFHLEIGRRMWRRFDEKAVDLHLFTLLSQMNLGRRLITRERERIAVATLCLHAGIKAARSSTFPTASLYLDFGISLLGEDSWRHHYDLTLALHNAGAEMSMCTSNFERSDELVESVLKNARILCDKTQAYSTRIYALCAMGKQKESIEVAFEVLERLGEPMSRNLSHRTVRAEFLRVKKLLRGKSDEQLLRMPLMTDKNKMACLQMLNLIFLSSLFAHPAFNPFITLRMVKITMEFGLSGFAASSFANYGMFIITHVHDIENAYRYGSLGEKLLSRFEAHEYMPRVHAAFYGCIFVFRKPVCDALGPLLEGYKVGLKTGDMEGAFMCMNLYCLNAIEAGVSITQIQREWEGFRESMLSTQYTSFLKITIVNLQTLHHLSGKTVDPLASKGDLIDYEDEMSLALERKDYMVYLALSISRMILAYYFNDLDLAARFTGSLRFLNKVPPSIKKISSGLFGGLVVLALARDGRKRRANLRFARWIIRIMDYLATQTPFNCLDKLFLLEAEYASVIGKNDLANKKYVCAVGMAKNAGFPFYAALGYELWARHLYRVGDTVQSRTYFEESCRLNREIGALRKVERLETEMQQMFAGQSMYRTRTGSGGRHS